MIYTVTLNPALDKTITVPGLRLGETNRLSASRCDPGGKGINVSKVIAALGGESVALALLGGETGRSIHGAVSAMGIACLPFFTGMETRINWKLVDPETGVTTEINGQGQLEEPGILQEMLDSLCARLHCGDLVVLSGSLPQGAPPETYRDWITCCRERGAVTVLDTSGAALELGLQAQPALVKPNRAELAQLLARPVDTPRELRLGCRELLERGVERVVVSLGREGFLYCDRENRLFSPALQVKTGSTVGAGDSLVAALTLAMERRMAPQAAVPLAGATAAANVMGTGTQAASREAVEALLDQVRCIPWPVTV